MAGWHRRLASVRRKHWQDASATRCQRILPPQDHPGRSAQRRAASFRQAAERLQFVAAQRQGVFEEPVVGVKDDKFGPRQPAHLPQHRVGQRESGVGQGGDDADEVVLLPSIRPVYAQIGDRPAGQGNGEQDDGKEGKKELDLDRPPHLLILSSFGRRRQSDGGRGWRRNSRNRKRCANACGFAWRPGGNTGKAGAARRRLCRGV